MPSSVLGTGCANLHIGPLWWPGNMTSRLRPERWVGVGQVKREVAVQSPPNSRLTLLLWLHCSLCLPSKLGSAKCVTLFNLYFLPCASHLLHVLPPPSLLNTSVPYPQPPEAHLYMPKPFSCLQMWFCFIAFSGQACWGVNIPAMLPKPPATDWQQLVD